MTIRKLKELITNLPGDMRVYADDGSVGMFSDNSEFVTVVLTAHGANGMCVLQTKRDFDVNEEVTSMRDHLVKKDTDDIYKEDFWHLFSELGYSYDDFKNPADREDAKKNLIKYGLI